MLKKYFSFNTWVVLTVIILVEVVYNYLLKEFVLSEQILYNSLATELTIDQIEMGRQMASSLSWLFYLLVPFSVIVPILLIALCLNIGALVKRYEIPFATLFGIVVKAYGIYVLARIVRLLIYRYSEIEKISDFNYLPQLSLYDLFDLDTLSVWMIYPLQLINVFGIVFILLLATGLELRTQKGWRSSLGFVLGTYGLGLLIWMAIIIFLGYL